MRRQNGSTSAPVGRTKITREDKDTVNHGFPGWGGLVGRGTVSLPPSREVLLMCDTKFWEGLPSAHTVRSLSHLAHVERLTSPGFPPESLPATCPAFWSHVSESILSLRRRMPLDRCRSEAYRQHFYTHVSCPCPVQVVQSL
jgi:hypothetical protein